MAQLFFEYGVMASGKSIELLKVAYSYEVQNKHAYLLTSALDDRTKIGEISSRLGLKAEANVYFDDTDIMMLISNQNQLPDIVLIDEAQFLSKTQVLQLTEIVDDLNIPVMAFGLKNDSSNRLFPGSEALLIYADKLHEIKTLDAFSSHKATMNLRIKNNQPVYDGSQIEIGSDDKYIPVSRRKYFHPDLKEIKDYLTKHEK